LSPEKKGMAAKLKMVHSGTGLVYYERVAD
jgi:hypothetical protein